MVSIMDGGMRRTMGNDPVVLFGVMFLECCVRSAAYCISKQSKSLLAMGQKTRMGIQDRECE
jgi:hypothetical protein